jgi:hypothetical protein
MEQIKNLEGIKIISEEDLNNLILDKKGYMFDSLVYRFKDYQSRAFQTEVKEYKYKRNSDEIEAYNTIKDRHNRDLMRFIEILNEAIGKHN